MAAGFRRRAGHPRGKDGAGGGGGERVETSEGPGEMRYGSEPAAHFIGGVGDLFDQLSIGNMRQVKVRSAVTADFVAVLEKLLGVAPVHQFDPGTAQAADAELTLLLGRGCAQGIGAEEEDGGDAKLVKLARDADVVLE